MPRTRRPPAPMSTRSLVPTSVTLALWRLRDSWRWLAMTGLGILVAVVLACAVPLFAQVALTSGVRAVLTASPQDAEIELQVNARALSTEIAAADNARLRQFARASFGSYLSSYSQFELDTPGLNLAIPGQEKDTLALTGVSIDQARAHLRLIQGRLPLASSPDLEVALTQRTATSLQVAPGGIVPLQFAFYVEQAAGVSPQSVTLQLDLHVVGLVALDTSDLFWHAQNFDPVRTDFASSYRAIMSSDAFLATITRLARAHGGALAGFDAPPALLWYFFLNPSLVTIGNLDDLIAHLEGAQLHLNEQITQLPALQHPQLLSPAMSTFGGPGSLERFRERLPVILIPLVMLTLQVLLLILLFISMLVNLFVERQAQVMALLRSRGASRRQLLNVYAVHTLALGLLALLAGPALAVLLVRALGSQMLTPSDQGALSSVIGNPLTAALGLSGYAAVAALGAMLTMLLSIWGAARRDLLGLRRELARPTQRPFWQRLRLDEVAIIIALSGYGVSLAMTHSGALDARTNQILFLPVSLVGPVFLLVAAALLFLRFFPLLLRFFARQTARRPGAPPMLALAQLSRAPQPSLRLLLLLALSVSFAIFTLVFGASENQYMRYVAAQQVGADFSGPIPVPLGSHPDANTLERAYRAVPGVISATIGNVTDGISEQSGQERSIQIRAVDTGTFAQTAIWTDQDSSQPLKNLLAPLVNPIQGSDGAPVVPALVDAVAWNALQLAPGSRFTLNISGSPVSLVFQAIAEVQHIPTINDSLETSGGADYVTPGGILVDLQQYTRVFAQASQVGGQTDANGLPPSVNYIWLRTSDAAWALASVRAALASGPLNLEAVYDRRAMLAQMQQDPLFLALNGVLLLGVAITVLLVLFSSVLASALHARRRQVSFAVLRALGSTPRQMSRVLFWELGIVYFVALALGIVFGLLLVLTVVPALVFTNPILPGSAVSSTEFYVIQHVLPTPIVLPMTVGWAVVVFAAVALLALELTTHLTARSALHQTLRLNED